MDTLKTDAEGDEPGAPVSLMAPVAAPGVPRRSGAPPKFVTGSLLAHIIEMTGAGALGLMAIFAGDLANLVFLSWLKDESVVAAVGYGSSILFLTVSIGIGLAIAATSLVSPAIGAGQRVKARRLSTHAHLATLAISLVLSFFVWLLIPQALEMLGAKGRTFDLASRYLTILIPSLAPLALGMAASGVLRSVGDARRAMNITLAGAVVNLILDPFLIFDQITIGPLPWLGIDASFVIPCAGLGLSGAAISTVIARFCVMAVGLYGVIHVHDLMGRPRPKMLRQDWALLSAVAVPAILTNVATPFSNAVVTSVISGHGDSAVAGWTIIGRILPVAFGAIYALSGSIGPILGQNYGARHFDRVREAFTLALKVTAAFTLAAWIVLALIAGWLAGTLHATGEAAEIIAFYCRVLAPLFVFMGALFIANAAFNTLGRPVMSTLLNWGRATLGTVPFAIAGGSLGGAGGVLAGHMVGGIAFGLLGVFLGYRLIDELAAKAADAAPPAPAVK